MEFRELKGLKTFVPQSRVELISYALANKKILVAVNAEKILHANTDFKALINANVGFPDGVGAVWALRKKKMDAFKIPGCELWLDIVEKYHSTKSFYLIGSTYETINVTVNKIESSYPNINIVGFRDGYINSDIQRKEILEDVLAAKPDIVFVAMGSPKQELLMQELQQIHPALYQGLGGSFDVFTGNVQRAPKWWVKNNLEWAYRLVRQPKRILRQVHLVKFFLILQFNKI